MAYRYGDTRDIRRSLLIDAGNSSGSCCRFDIFAHFSRLSFGYYDGEILQNISLESPERLRSVSKLAAIRAKWHGSNTGIFRSHVTSYLISLLVSDLLQSMSSDESSHKHHR